MKQLAKNKKKLYLHWLNKWLNIELANNFNVYWILLNCQKLIVPKLKQTWKIILLMFFICTILFILSIDFYGGIV